MKLNKPLYFLAAGLLTTAVQATKKDVPERVAPKPAVKAANAPIAVAMKALSGSTKNRLCK